MYADMSARSGDIERGARRDAAEVLADHRESAGRLRDAVAGLPAASWGATVRSALVQLATEGLVERSPNRGASVRSLSIDEGSRSASSWV